MSAAFSGWTMPITLVVIKQRIIEGFNKDVGSNKTFNGTIQPLSPKQLILKPEGERAWEWIMIHCETGELLLDDGDRIVYNGKTYKVMGNNDYSLNNFNEYHLVRDYEAKPFEQC